MKLTPRLKYISELVSDGKKIADIGTDHGYIPISLLLDKKISFAILSDINRGPLNNAKKEVTKNNVQNYVDLRLGSGMETLRDGEVDQVIIAGMGGILISEIIEKKIELSKKLDKLILQPMQAPEELRKYLYSNDFDIIEEHFVKEDHRIYEIIEVKYSKESHTRKIHEEYKEYIFSLIEKFCNNSVYENEMKQETKQETKQEIKKTLITHLGEKSSELEVDNTVLELLGNVMENLFFEVTPIMIQKRDSLMINFLEKKISECESIVSKIENSVFEDGENKIDSVLNNSSVKNRILEVLIKKILLDFIKYDMEAMLY